MPDGMVDGDRRVLDRIGHDHDRPAVWLLGQASNTHPGVLAQRVHLHLVESDTVVSRVFQD